MNLEGFQLVSDKVLDITKAESMHITNSIISDFWLYMLLYLSLAFVFVPIVFIIKSLIAYRKTPTDEEDIKHLKKYIIILMSFIFAYAIISAITVSYLTKADVVHDLEYVKEVKAKDITNDTYKSKGISGGVIQASLKGDMKKNYMNAKINDIPVHQVIDKTPKTLNKDDKVKITLKTQYIKAPKNISLKEYSKMVAHNKKTKLDNNVVILEPVE